jgi:glutaredoxin
MRLAARIALAAAVLAAGAALAQQYRWVDEKGRIQYSDSPPPPTAKDVQKMDLRGAKPKPAPLPFELARLQKDFPVTLYSSPTCKEACEMARDALNKRGIPFKEVQVWDPDTNEELKRVSGAAEVPTLLVGRTAQRGFEQGLFDTLLDSAGYPRAGILPARTQKAPEPPEGYVPPAERETAKPVAKPEPAAAPPKLGRYATPEAPGGPVKPGPYATPEEAAGPAKPGPYAPPGATR